MTTNNEFHGIKFHVHARGVNPDPKSDMPPYVRLDIERKPFSANTLLTASEAMDLALELIKSAREITPS